PESSPARLAFLGRSLLGPAESPVCGHRASSLKCPENGPVVMLSSASTDGNRVGQIGRRVLTLPQVPDDFTALNWAARNSAAARFSSLHPCGGAPGRPCTSVAGFHCARSRRCGQSLHRLVLGRNGDGILPE